MKTRTMMVTAMAAVVALSVTACGGDSPKDQPQAGASAGLTKVTLDALKIGQLAPVVLAQEKGIFKKHGIDLTISYVAPPALVPSLMSGDADFIWNNAVAVLAARGNKVPIKSVTTNSVAGDDPTTFPVQVMVAKGSAITTPQELVGKTVATASLFQVNDIAFMESLNKAGADAKKVKFVEIPFPNMAQALAAGRVDAIISTEPFVTIAKESGKAVNLVSVTKGLPPKTPFSVYASSEKFIAANPEVVKKFRAAIDETTTYALAHDAEVRATIPKITDLTPEMAKKITLAPLSTTDDPAGWNAWAELLVQVGVLKDKPNAADAFLPDN